MSTSAPVVARLRQGENEDAVLCGACGAKLGRIPKMMRNLVPHSSGRWVEAGRELGDGPRIVVLESGYERLRPSVFRMSKHAREGARRHGRPPKARRSVMDPLERRPVTPHVAIIADPYPVLVACWRCEPERWNELHAAKLEVP